MSEYQYYEFQAIDRPLTKAEQAEVRALSTRAIITPTRFVNVYNFGDFRGDPLALMERYYDAFVYVANWGTHRFMLRLPRHVLDPEAAARYAVDGGLDVQIKGNNVILEFRSDDEAGDWEETGEECLSALTLRAELAAGDLRSLYLGWLAAAQIGGLDDDAVAPPMPPGLGSPSAALSALADFLRLDADLLAVAATRGAERAVRPSRRDLAAWLHDLPEGGKDAWLLRLAEGNDPHLVAAFRRRFTLAAAGSDGGRPATEAGGSAVAALLEAAEERAEIRRRAEAERAAQERARREREAAAARAAHLARLTGREADLWRQVEALVETKRPTDYDQAAHVLVDLRDLAARGQTTPAVAARLAALRTRHARKISFLARLDEGVRG